MYVGPLQISKYIFGSSSKQTRLDEGYSTLMEEALHREEWRHWMFEPDKW